MTEGHLKEIRPELRGLDYNDRWRELASNVRL
jgi:hypothetical protein